MHSKMTKMFDSNTQNLSNCMVKKQARRLKHCHKMLTSHSTRTKTTEHSRDMTKIRRWPKH